MAKTQEDESMIIGYLSDGYADRRCIVNVVNDARYKNVKRENLFIYLWVFLSFLCKNRIIRHLKVDRYFEHFGMNLTRVDLYHLFNSISFSNKPWIVTFESFIPRYSELMINVGDGRIEFPRTKNLEKAFRTLSSSNCKKIIALSECNKKMQENLLKLFPEFENTIISKLCCIHPCQNLYVKSFQDKKIDIAGKISFMFVGRDFFTKGGREIVRAFQNIVERHGFPITLRIVSSMAAGNYANYATPEDISVMEQTVKNTEWIEYYRELPNREVIRLMLISHVGMLPTWADTFGYSVLEFQATGCPVISTDVRALPEINNDDIGYLIKVPRNEAGEGLYMTETQRIVMSQVITKGIEDAVLKIFEDKRQIVSKSARSIANVARNHNPADYAEKIRAIYLEALHGDRQSKGHGAGPFC